MLTRRKKIAIVSPFPLFPSTGGNRARTLSYVRLMKEIGFEVWFILLPSRRMGSYDERMHVDLFADRFIALRRDPAYDVFYYARRALASTARKLLRSRFRLWRVDESFHSAFIPALAELDLNVRFDAVIVQYVTSSAAFRGFRREVIRLLDTHDAFVGQIPESEERLGLERADRVIAIQEDEARYFKTLLGVRERAVSVVSHIVPPSRSPSLGTCEGASFLGSRFPQNEKSICWFVDRVLPIVRAAEPSFVLNVAGSISAAVEGRAGVRAWGVVPDPMAVYERAPILANCIVEGSGVKIKLLEAMGAGLAVVSTRLGVKGIPAAFLSGVLLVEDGDAAVFASSILQLFRNCELRERLGALNRETIVLWNREQVSAFQGLFNNKT